MYNGVRALITAEKSLFTQKRRTRRRQQRQRFRLWKYIMNSLREEVVEKFEIALLVPFFKNKQTWHLSCCPCWGFQYGSFFSKNIHHTLPLLSMLPLLRFSGPSEIPIFGHNFKIYENLRIMKKLSSRLSILNPKAESENFSLFSEYSQFKLFPTVNPFI